jgi:hypothetical protein
VSYQATMAVFENVPGSLAAGSDRLVLLALANHASGDTMECWPSISLLAREAGVTPDTVKRSLRILVDRGLIERVINGAPDQRIPRDRRPNLYRLNLTGGTDTGPRETGSRETGGREAPERGGESRVDGGENHASTGGRDTPPKQSGNIQGTVTEQSEGVGDAGASTDATPWRDALVEKHGHIVVEDAERLARLMADRLTARGYTANIAPTSKAWVLGMVRCVTSDTRAKGDPDRVSNAIEFLYDRAGIDHDGFWSDQVRSPQKLYDKWDDLRAAGQRWRTRRPTAADRHDATMARLDELSAAARAGQDAWSALSAYEQPAIAAHSTEVPA